MSRSTSAGRAGELAGRVQRLELLARRNVAGTRIGDYRTAIRGRGLLFVENRRYVEGEPARHIDWNVTARLGEPHVRVHAEERQREVVIAVDASPSMHGGWQERTKLETAIELAATLAVSAADAGDRIGHVLFADRILDRSPPRAGRAQLFRVLAALLAGAEPWNRPVAESDPRLVFHELERSRRGRFVVFLISDLVDHDLPDDLRYAHPRHDVSVLWVHDPAELDPAPVAFEAVAPEGSTRRSRVRPGHLETGAQTRARLERRCAERGLAFAPVATDEAPHLALLDLFARRRRLRAGAR